MDVRMHAKAIRNFPIAASGYKACSAGILASFTKYNRKCAEKLRNLPPSSKAWWPKTTQLLDVKPKTSNIHALKSESGTWIFKPKAKAKLFAEKCTAK